MKNTANLEKKYKLPCTFRFKPLPLILQASLFCGLSMTPVHTQAQNLSDLASHLVNAPTASTTPLQSIIITGSRHEQALADLPQAATVITRQEMDATQAQSIKDLAENLANISVRHAPSRFAITGPANATGRDGNSGFTLRGMGGNRVLMLVDGVRQPRSYLFGGNAFGRDYLSLDLVDRVEIIRGATSSLYGSDGMGGMVQLFTPDPHTYLKAATSSPSDRPAYAGRSGLMWDSSHRSLRANGLIAGSINEEWQWLISLSGSKGHETETRGDQDWSDTRRTTANPQNDHDRGALLKTVYRTNAKQKHVFTYENVRTTSDVHLLSSVSMKPYTGTASAIANAVLDERGSNEKSRYRLSWQGTWKNLSHWSDELEIFIANQKAHSLQTGFSDLNTAKDRLRETTYDEKNGQAHLRLLKKWQLNEELHHILNYGWDWQQTEMINWVTGQEPIAPEKFPLKRFPNTREGALGFYAQSEWLGKHWSVTPALRWDSYQVHVLTQEGFFPPAKVPARDLDNSAWSPRLGLLYRPTSELSLFANFNTGFRSPSASQVNAYFDVPITGKRVVIDPNPDLQAEKSHGYELGLRGKYQTLDFQFSFFDNRYRNLIIDSVMVSDTATERHFQARNVDAAKITGWELEGTWKIGQAYGAKWSMPFAWGASKGHNTSNHLPLNSIDPQKISLGLQAHFNDWVVQGIYRHTNAKTASEVDSTPLAKSNNWQATIPAANTWDIYTQYTLYQGWKLQAAITNISNQKYWRWADVVGVAANSPVLDAYSQAGRHYKIGLQTNF